MKKGNFDPPLIHFSYFMVVHFQVNPTVLNVENCKTQHYPITITPTIPVRKTNLNGKDALPKLNFRTPKEVVILGKHCEVDLKQGIKPVQVLVRAACLQAHQVSVNPQPIIPKISFSNSPFWNRTIKLPIIWVIIIFLLLLIISFFFFSQQFETNLFLIAFPL